MNLSKSFWSIFLFSLFICIISFYLLSCEKVELQPFLVSGCIVGDSVDIDSIHKIYAVSYYGDSSERDSSIISDADFEGGCFSLELPVPPEQEVLYTMELLDTAIRVGNTALKVLPITAFECEVDTNNFYNIHYISVDSVNGVYFTASFVYADRKCNIYTLSNKYDIRFDEGWNIVYTGYNLDNNDSFVITTRRPKENFQWQFKGN